MFWLLFAHCMGDIAFQNGWVYENKRKSLIFLGSHAIIWSGCVAIALFFLGLYDLWKIPFLVIGHFAMDGYKVASLKEDDPKYNNMLAWLDQVFHLVQLGVVYYL